MEPRPVEACQCRLIAQVPLLPLAFELDLVRNRNFDRVSEQDSRAGPVVLDDAIDEPGIHCQAA